MNTHPLFGLLFFLLPVGFVAGQTVATEIPGPGVGAVAPSRTALVLAPRSRSQAVVGRSHLAALKGCLLTGVTFRHLNDSRTPIVGGEIDLTLQLSTPPHTPCSVLPLLDANHGPDRVTAFQGRVVFNALAAYGGSAPTPWNDARNLTVLFTKPFPYSGQDLCLELECRERQGRTLPEWFAHGLVPANLPPSTTPLGSATVGTTAGFTPKLFGVPGPGETFPLGTDGVLPNLPAILVVGISAASWGPFGLPLTVARSAGAPVELRVSPDLILPTVSRGLPPVVDLNGQPLGTQPTGWERQGWAQVELQVPWTPNLAACSIYAQWFALADLGTPATPQLAAGPGLRLDLVGARNHLDLAWLHATSSDPQVRPTRDDGPTLRFTPNFRLTGKH